MSHRLIITKGSFSFCLSPLNEMKLIFKSTKPRRLVGLNAHQDGFKPVNFVEWPECASLHEIEVNVNLLVYLKNRLEAPSNYVLK